MPYNWHGSLFCVPGMQVWQIQTHSEILEEPRFEDAGSRLGKYSAFALHSTTIRAAGIIVIARVVARLVTVVT